MRSRKASTHGHAPNGVIDPLPAPRERNARVSFFDPANQTTLDRLISGEDAESPEDGDGANEETAEDTLTSVEEMLEGYEWASDDMMSIKRARGATDQVESRLLNELMALEKVEMLPIRRCLRCQADPDHIGQHTFLHRVR
jgi:exocyst complex component 1